MLLERTDDDFVITHGSLFFQVKEILCWSLFYTNRCTNVEKKENFLLTSEKKQMHCMYAKSEMK